MPLLRRLVKNLSDIIHFFYGFFTSFLLTVNYMASLEALLLFVFYELLEQLRIWDKSYKDILEYAIGWSLGVIFFLVI